LIASRSTESCGFVNSSRSRRNERPFRFYDSAIRFRHVGFENSQQVEFAPSRMLMTGWNDTLKRGFSCVQWKSGSSVAFSRLSPRSDLRAVRIGHNGQRVPQTLAEWKRGHGTHRVLGRSRPQAARPLLQSEAQKRSHLDSGGLNPLSIQSPSAIAIHPDVSGFAVSFSQPSILIRHEVNSLFAHCRYSKSRL
jgi:hypothetical protein